MMRALLDNDATPDVFPEIAMQNGLDLPPGWARTTISEITQPVEKVDPTEEPDKEFIYLDISSIDNITNTITAPKMYQGADAPSRARQLVQAHDVLFSTVRTYLKNIAQVPETCDGQVASTGFAVLRGKEGVLSKYLFYFCLTENFLDTLGSLQRGTSYPAVRDSDVREQPIPLPPLAEQRRIVAAIEEQFTQLDAGIAALKRAQANLRRYRASVLKAACEGSLVPQDPSDEPASALLDRILAERRAKWEAEQLRKMEAQGKQPLLDTWKVKYVAPTPPSTEGLPELPEGWCWATVEQLAAHEPRSITDGPFGSNLKTEHYTDVGPRVIRLQNIGDGKFIDEKAHISSDHFAKLKKHQVLAGDLVIAALGETLPRACIIPDFVGQAIVKADCIRLKPDSAFVDGRYLNAALNSEVVKKAAQRIVHGIGRPRLNQQEIKSLPVPLPPLAEQQRIVAEVERRLSVVDQLDVVIAANLNRAERLRQAILRQAFAGKLVPQDLADEPASVVLERIRTEREGQLQKGKRGVGQMRLLDIEV